MDTTKMSAILSQLGGNPFNTPVGQKIEHATDMSLASENWALNMEICDLISDTDEGPKDAVKAIRKRLQQNAGKNYTVVMYTLTVLETCVKNCGRRFHLLITQKDFVQDLVKLIGPKNDPPTAVQEKVLSLIQSWADAFRAIPEMQGVVQVYNDLKQKGIEFPMTDLDAMAPIHTPQRSVLASEMNTPVHPPHRPERVLPQEPTLTVPHSQPQAVPSPVSLSPEQLAKLRSELDIVQANMKVFGEMLTELVPGKEHPSDLELLNDLRQTCHAMQSRVVQLIDNVANEEVTSELLRVNDELNNLFLRYERFDKKRSSMGSQLPKQQPPVPVADSKPLIDLGDDLKSDDIQTQLANMSMGIPSAASALGQLSMVPATAAAVAAAVEPLEGSDEFDMFAQSRNVTYEQTKSSGSTYADNMSGGDQASGIRSITTAKAQPGKEEPELDLIHKLHREQDFDEMERWLEDKPTSGQDSITSSEFDRFLAERAAATETTPPTTGSTTSTTPTRQSGNPPTRRRINHEEQENTLFAL